MSANPRWKQRPPGSNWGDFGPDDRYFEPAPGRNLYLGFTLGAGR